jgi:SAM-dependent methyltransferase
MTKQRPRLGLPTKLLVQASPLSFSTTTKTVLAMSSTLTRNGKSKPATIAERAIGLYNAFMLVSTLYFFGIPHAIYVQVTSLNPLQWVNPIRWRNLIIEVGLPKLLKLGDADSGPLKREALYPHVKGKVLELGAGTGLTLAYYNHAAIDQLILVEPFLKLHQELKQNIANKGKEFEKKTKIVPFGIEQTQKLQSVKDIKEASFDTIVLVQVLCSIPNRKENLPYLQSLLKPGGQLILFEHVAADDPVTNLFQRLYNPLWTTLSAGCNINRHSADMVRNLGGWKEVQVRVPKEQHSGTLYPSAIGRYVKA